MSLPQSRTLQRALELLGSKERLAAALWVARADLDAYLDGHKPVPTAIFPAALDMWPAAARPSVEQSPGRRCSGVLAPQMPPNCVSSVADLRYGLAQFFVPYAELLRPFPHFMVFVHVNALAIRRVRLGKVALAMLAPSLDAPPRGPRYGANDSG